MQQGRVPPPVSVHQKTLDAIQASRRLSAAQQLHSPEQFQQYSRVTVTVDDAAQALALVGSTPQLSQYDILAASPTSQPAFLQLCKQAEIDIISLDVSHKLAFQVDLKNVNDSNASSMLFYVSCLFRFQLLSREEFYLRFAITILFKVLSNRYAFESHLLICYSQDQEPEKRCLITCKIFWH
jgi:hypothetical protein